MKVLKNLKQKDFIRYVSDPHGDGHGISQNADTISPDLKLDLSKEDWYVFNDNYGTSEEKSFVKYFSNYVDSLKIKYSKVYLVRNERKLVIRSFVGGERFEPDYLLFLLKENSDGMTQYQIFIEPKGGIFIDPQIWKEELLLSLEKEAIPVKTFVDDNKYLIWGFPFYNREKRMADFDKAMEVL